MNHPIALHEFDEDEYRNRVRTPSDDNLLEKEDTAFLVRRHHQHGNGYTRLGLISCRVNLRECPDFIAKIALQIGIKKLSWILSSGPTWERCGIILSVVFATIPGSSNW